MISPDVIITLQFLLKKESSDYSDCRVSSMIVMSFFIAATTTKMNQIPQISTSTIPFFGRRDKKLPKKVITKDDISMPTDFRHVVSGGWTPRKGFNLNVEDVENVNLFLERAGVSEQQLNDRETRNFIDDFIESNNVLDSVKPENAEHAQPPVVATFM